MSRSRRRSALRLAARVALFALIGAAVTVLVGWGCMIREVEYTDTEIVGERRWPAAVPRDWPGQPASILRHDAFAKTIWSARSWEVPPRRTAPCFWMQGLGRAGWPARSSQLVIHGRQEGNQLVEHSSSLGRFIGGEFDSMPTDLLWPGFLVDTVFYGGLAFVVWGSPGLVRRRVRRRRGDGGRCAACGYDLSGAGAAGGGVCPECGGGGA